MPFLISLFLVVEKIAIKRSHIGSTRETSSCFIRLATLATPCTSLNAGLLSGVSFGTSLRVEPVPFVLISLTSTEVDSISSSPLSFIDDKLWFFLDSEPE